MARKMPSLRESVFFWFFAFTLGVPAALATAVVGIKANNGFIIAADSKVTYMGHANAKKGPETVCKIFQLGSIYFTFAGLTSDQDRGFFPATVMANNFSFGDTFAQNIQKMEIAVSGALKIEMQRLKIEDPDNFALNNKPGADTLSIIAGQMVGGEPQMSGRGFKYLAEISAIDINRINCPGDCPDGFVDIFFAGESDVAKMIWLQDRDTPLDLIEESRKLVDAEIQASPQIVGPPITILKVDKYGASWISNDAGCPVVLAPSF